MSQLKNVVQLQQLTGELTDTAYGDSIPISGVSVFGVQCVVDVDTPSAKTFDSGAANVSDTAVVADVGVKEISDITCVAEAGVCEVSDVTCVADVAGSLNSTYFNYQTRASGGATTVNRYAWFNVNGAGIDPAPVGRTGVAVALATDAADTAVATALRAALAADTNVTITGGTTHCIITNKYMGTAVDADNGTASPGFSFSITAGVASNLLNKYFNYETKNLAGATVNLRYGWYNVNGEGADPAPASRTGISIPIVLSAVADTDVASATRTALAADTKVAITGGTNHCIITNVNMGNVVNAANGAASPGFSYAITPGVASTINNAYMTFSETANAVNYAAWFNINSEGTDPALAGKTMIEVEGAASISANDLATAARDAIDAAIGAAIVISGATNHIILTNSTRGTCTQTANGAVSPGFTVTPTTPGVNTEVDTTEDTVGIPSHGMTTGIKGQLTTTGTLPAGLSLSTDYFIIVEDADNVAFASSLALAQAGTKLDITDTGADASVNTFTSTSIAGANVKLQKSMDGSNWTDEGSATNITADANLWLEKVDPSGLYMRLAFAITAGRFSSTNNILGKGIG